MNEYGRGEKVIERERGGVGKSEEENDRFYPEPHGQVTNTNAVLVVYARLLRFDLLSEFR